MRITKARPQLGVLITQLGSWEVGVPARARRFHALRTELLRAIEGAMPRWSLWLGDEIVERYRDRVSRLRSLAERLATLLERTEEVEAEVRRLAELRLSDPGLADWLRTRCRDWLASLGRLGEGCEREADVSTDDEIRAASESAVRLLHEAILQLGEADRVLGAIGQDVRAAALSASLPQFCRRLSLDGATPEWIDELKALIQPLEPVAARIQDPPRELGEARVILGELRGWAALFTDDEPIERDIERLRERQFHAADWDPAEAQELVNDAQRLRAQLLERAASARAVTLQQMEQSIADLRQACGDQRDLEATLADLTTRATNRPPLFRDWLARAEKLHQSFQSVAQSHVDLLETRLLETRARIARTLEELEHRPLSDETRRAAALFAQDLRRFHEAANGEEALVQLSRTNAIARDVERLERRAEEDLREIEQRQRQLTAKHESLRLEAMRVKGVALDLATTSARIAALNDGTEERSLEDRRRDAESLGAELETLESTFMDRCRVQLDVHLASIDRTTSILQQAGSEPPSTVPPSIAKGATLHEAATAVIRARQIHHALLRLARELRKSLEARQERAKTMLEGLRPDDLGPAERQHVEHLFRELRDVASSRISNLIDALELRASVVHKCDQFFELLQRERRGADEKLAALQLRFREFTAEHLDRFCPELSDRVAALIYGVPRHARHWRSVHEQLDRAAELFGRLRSYAERLAVDELDRAAETLRIRLRGANDSSLQKLLAELDACQPEVFVPAALRQRAVTAAQQRV